MNQFRLTIKYIKEKGGVKTLHRIKDKTLSLFFELNAARPIWYYYWKLKCACFLLPRFGQHTVRILGFKVTFNDLKSLYIEYKDIFKNHIYYFTPDPTTDTPLIIDGGGFIGFSVLFFKYYYPKARIIVFEPSAHVLPLLKKNIIQNNLTDVELIEVGLGAKEKTVHFNISDTDAGRIDEAGTAEIVIKPLSQYINSNVDFLKLNIEGAEIDVLKDLDATGKLNNIKQLCIEWHSFSYTPQNLDVLLAILAKNNFKYVINHFDYISNRAVKPPFTVSAKTQYYLLVYAKKIDQFTQG